MTMKPYLEITLMLALTVLLGSVAASTFVMAYIPGGVVGTPNMPDVVTKPYDIPGGVPGTPNLQEGPAHFQGDLGNIFGP
jgi:hypothetical protein